MAPSRTKPMTTVPPQLLGVLNDAIQIAATSCKLEVLPSVIMASFSTPSEATEIDFETEAGQQMIDYLMARVRGRRTSRVVIEHGGRQLECQVTSDKKRQPSWVQISWACGQPFDD